nr:CocE/NonD family hydrolase [Pseudonocardia sp. AL041005-10]
MPAYVVASWTNPLHTQGTLEAFRELGSSEKWLRVHHEQEWIDIADPSRLHDLQRFFDHYLKGADNGWEATPRVRMSVLDPGGAGDVVDRAEQQWPPARVRTRTLHLDAGTGGLSEQPPAAEGEIAYRGDGLTASVRFSFVADRETEITGYPALHLWVESDEADDLDLFAAIYKESAGGRRLHHITLRDPKARAHVESLAVDGNLPGMLAYTGPVGRIRASRRATDPKRSTPTEPYLTHAAEELVTPGTPVLVPLALWPTAMLLHTGERLVVEIAGHPVGPLSGENHPGGRLDVPTRNRGTHRIRTGGRFDSVLLLPDC